MILTKNQKMIAFAVAVVVVVGGIIAGIVLSQSKDPVKPATRSSGATTKPTPKLSESQAAQGLIECIDRNEKCAYWVSNGECTNNPRFMKINCTKSCNFCTKPGETCFDLNHFCSEWADKGDCSSNPIFMKENCNKSCKFCT